MPSTDYRTTPDATDRMPGGIPYIIGNEAAERFSFYGMRAILVIFMTQHLRNSTGVTDTMSEDDAKSVYHLFLASAYFFPLLGSLISDILWGKYKTILILSLGYCVGHLCLAMGDTGIGAGLLEPRNWLFLGLIFIAIGAGGIKPCVSAHVGDQFGPQNKGLLSKTFGWFYFSINVGATVGYLLTPYLLEHKDYGPAYAFGLPGVLMALATLMFWMGRNKFVHIPPAGKQKFLQETFDRQGLRALLNLSPLFLIFVPMFWAIFDQSGSSWVLQATRLDRNFMGIEWYEAQVGAVNPVLILILIPTFAYVVYPAMAKFFDPTPLRKVGIGLFIAALSFAVSGWIESRLTGGAIQGVSSQADRDEWRVIHLLDGDTQECWLSAPSWSPSAEEPFEQEVVIRLSDYQSWPVDRVVLHPVPEDTVLPEPKEDLSALSADEVKKLRSPQACRPQMVQIFVGDAPKPADGWRELATITFVEESAEAAAGQAVFPPAEAKYIKLVARGNFGGAFLGLAEVEVFADDEAGAEINVATLGDRPSIGWQFLAYLILTIAEVMVSIVCLEFAYTQAPKNIKSFIMGVFWLGVSLGNLLTAGVNSFISNQDGSSKLEGVAYYQFFTYAMLATAIVYVIWSQFYRGETYIQGDEN